MEIVVALIVTLALLAGAAVAIVAIVHRKQQRAITRDNQLMPGRPTRAPRSWAVSHDPEARLHRRLRDAMAALLFVMDDPDDGGRPTRDERERNDQRHNDFHRLPLVDIASGRVRRMVPV